MRPNKKSSSNFVVNTLTTANQRASSKSSVNSFAQKLTSSVAPTSAARGGILKKNNYLDAVKSELGNIAQRNKSTNSN